MVYGLDLAREPAERRAHGEGLAQVDHLQHRPVHIAVSGLPKRVPPVSRGTAPISALV